jgi:hypothetical protein
VSELLELQRWFEHAVTGPEPEAERVECVLLPGPRLTARERLEVHRRGYVARLVECLEDDYPVLAETLGGAAFADVAAGYIASHPTNARFLDRYGAALSEHLRGARLGLAGPFLVDLAALEWAVVEAIHASEVSRSFPPLESVSLEAWATATFVGAPSVRLLRSDFPIDRYYQARRDGGRPALPSPEPSATLVQRRGFAVFRTDLGPVRADLLEALLAGETLELALDRACRAESAAPLVMDALREWVADGVFASISLG